MAAGSAPVVSRSAQRFVPAPWKVRRGGSRRRKETGERETGEPDQSSISVARDSPARLSFERPIVAANVRPRRVILSSSRINEAERRRHRQPVARRAPMKMLQSLNALAGKISPGSPTDSNANKVHMHNNNNNVVHHHHPYSKQPAQPSPASQSSNSDQKENTHISNNAILECALALSESWIFLIFEFEEETVEAPWRRLTPG
ncbi:hypothetical protein KM043_005400 [Ampulex compressa]|nr:hypothetical protein KM043_005400 [Ampulex compressa]